MTGTHLPIRDCAKKLGQLGGQASLAQCPEGRGNSTHGRWGWRGSQGREALGLLGGHGRLWFFHRNPLWMLLVGVYVVGVEVGEDEQGGSRETRQSLLLSQVEMEVTWSSGWREAEDP